MRQGETDVLTLCPAHFQLFVCANTMQDLFKLQGKVTPCLQQFWWILDLSPLRLQPLDAVMHQISHIQHHCCRETDKRTSKYRGVSWNSAGSKWVAVLWDRGLKRARHIGTFDSELDAARAYDRAARQLIGPSARLNFR